MAPGAHTESTMPAIHTQTVLIHRAAPNQSLPRAYPSNVFVKQ